MTERSSPNIALVTLMAGMAGAGLALLFAPRTGKDTRDKINQRSTELKDQAHDGYQHVRDTVNSGIEKTRDSLTEAINRTGRIAKEQYDELGEPGSHTGKKQSPVLRAWEEEI